MLLSTSSDSGTCPHYGAEQFNACVVELTGMVEAAEAKTFTLFPHRGWERPSGVKDHVTPVQIQ